MYRYGHQGVGVNGAMTLPSGVLGTLALMRPADDFLSFVTVLLRYVDGAGNTVEENSSVFSNPNALVAFSALTLLVGWQAGHPARKKMGGCWRWALVSLDGVALSRTVCLPLLIFPCTINPEVLFWHWLTRVVPEKGHKTVVYVCS